MSQFKNYGSETIMGQFLNVAKDMDPKNLSDSDIQAVSEFFAQKTMEIAVLISNEQMSDEVDEEIKEFYRYYKDHWLTHLDTNDRRNKVLIDQFILDLGTALTEDDDDLYELVLTEEYLAMPEKLKKESELFVDQIMEIDEKRIIECYSMRDFSYMVVPPNEQVKNPEEKRIDLLNMAAEMLSRRGRITVTVVYEDRMERFGFRGLPIGMWEPISKAEQESIDTVAKDGTRLAPEPGTVYIDFRRTKF